METASVSMNTGHPTHPLFKSMRKGMGRLGGLGARADNATAHGYSGNADWGASSGLSAFSSSTPRALFSPFWRLSLAKQTLRVFAQRACGQSARSTDVESISDVAKVQ